MIFILFFLSGCYNSSSTFCSNLAEEYSQSLKQDETLKIHSWDSLYVHHKFLTKPLLENWKKNSTDKERFFSLTFYAFLRSRSALKCGLTPKEDMIFSEKEAQDESLGFIKIEVKNHPYFKCLFSEWKEHSQDLIFKSCNYYFTR